MARDSRDLMVGRVCAGRKNGRWAGEAGSWDPPGGCPVRWLGGPRPGGAQATGAQATGGRAAGAIVLTL